jgi:S1-C subfamily serine protease
MSFYLAGVPVVHFFTGSHSDYHKPTDTVERINAGGAAQIAILTANTAAALSAREKALTYEKVPSPSPKGDLRSFNASLGTVPDYGGPPGGKKGVLLSAVRPGSAAEKGGMQRGDILTQLGKHAVGDVSDLMFVLNSSKPGETVTAVVQRGGKEVKVQVTFEESKRMR